MAEKRQSLVSLTKPHHVAVIKCLCLYGKGEPLDWTLMTNQQVLLTCHQHSSVEASLFETGTYAKCVMINCISCDWNRW